MGYCAAPVIRKEKAGMMVYFYVISRSKCCLTDAYNCKGWDHENGFVGEVIPLVEHRFHLYDKAALEAIEASAIGSDFQLNPLVVLLKVSEQEPHHDAAVHMKRGTMVNLIGLLLWPLPSLIAWSIGCQ